VKKCCWVQEEVEGNTERHLLDIHFEFHEGLLHHLDVEEERNERLDAWMQFGARGFRHIHDLDFLFLGTIVDIDGIEFARTLFYLEKKKRT